MFAGKLKNTKSNLDAGKFNLKMNIYHLRESVALCALLLLIEA